MGVTPIAPSISPIYCRYMLCALTHLGVYHPKVFFDQGILRWVFLTKVLFRKYASLGMPHEEVIRYFIRAQEILTPGARIVLKLPWRICTQSALKQHSVNSQQNTQAMQTAHNRRQHHNSKSSLKTASDQLMTAHNQH